MASALLLLILEISFTLPGTYPATAQGVSVSHEPQLRADVQAAPPVQPEQIANLGGDMRRISVAGGLAYVGENIGGSGVLSVLDVSSTPHRVGSVALPGAVVGMARAGSMVYLGLELPQTFDQIAVVDAANAQNPVLRGVYTLGTTNTPTQLVAVGARLYFGGGEFDGVTLLNVSNPANPTFVKAFGSSGNFIAVSGNRLVAGGGPQDTRVFDISNPDNPTEIGTTGGGGVSAQLAGNLLYTVGNDTLLVSDITKPRENATVGEYRTVGFNSSIRLAGNRAYVADDMDGLMVFDVSQPALPALIGAQPLPGVAADVDVLNGRAYIVGTFGLHVFDISAVARPRLLAGLPLPLFATDVRLVGSLAYVTEQVLDAQSDIVGGVLQIFDLSNPAAPVLRGTYTGLKRADSVAVSGNLAFVGEFGSFQILDISNPALPQKLGSLSASGVVRQIQVVGTRAYIAGLGMQIVDVSDPRRPQLLSTSLPQNSIGALSVAGNLVYAVVSGQGLVIMDVSNPLAPAVLSNTNDSQGSMHDIELVGSIAYVAGTDGLRIYDVQDPVNPLAITGYPGRQTGSTIIGAEDLQVAGDLLIMAAPSRGLQIMSIAIPARPALVGAFDGGINIWRIDASNGRAAALSNVGLLLLDLDARSAPRLQSTIDTVAGANSVQLVNGVAYIAAGTDGLQIFDMRNPAAPRRLSSYRPERNIDIQAVQVAGTTAYLASRQHGFDIVDVSNPRAPVSRGTYVTDIPTLQVIRLQAVGSLLYLSHESGLEIFDISQPAKPKPLGAYNAPLGTYDLQVTGGNAYIASGNGGLLIVDVRTPASPKLLKQYDTQNTAYGVSVANRRAYIANGDGGGLLILDLTNPAAPAPLGSLPMPGFAGRVRAVGNVAYLGVSTDLKVIDVSNPAAPVVRGSVAMPVNPADLQVDGRFVYTALSPGGLRVEWYAPAARTTIGAAGGALISAGDGTTYTFPAGTFTSPITLTHTPRYPGHLPSTRSLVGVDHAFELTTQDGAQIQAGVPTKPYTITVTYADAERGPAIEGTLALHAWDGSQWLKLPNSAVNTTTNKVTATTDRVGVFAVLGETRHVYLGIVRH